MIVCTLEAYVSLWHLNYSIYNNCPYPDDGYPDRLDPSGNFIEISTKLTCLEITGYRIEYSTML
jgi:hypothetical protein